jgi:hypothetical protein
MGDQTHTSRRKAIAMDHYARFSAQARTAVVGVQMRQMKIWQTIEQKVSSQEVGVE